MKIIEYFNRLLLRFRYPVSLPENIAEALGVSLSNFLTFDELVGALTSSSCKPTRLIRFMPREQAEQAFEGALCKECFREKSLFSYYFNEGWLEFILLFDEKSRLRRIYIQHKLIKQQEGLEIPLSVLEQS
jgi:hypothetical protein